MSIIDTLITDRTEADRARWLALRNKGFAAMTALEQTEWTAPTNKGAYNISDLNRVGEATAYLRDKLSEYGLVSTVTPKVNWVVGEVPLSVALVKLVADVKSLYTTLSQLPPDIPPTAERLTVQGANEIERALIALDETLARIRAAWFHLGEIYANEVTT